MKVVCVNQDGSSTASNVTHYVVVKYHNKYYDYMSSFINNKYLNAIDVLKDADFDTAYSYCKDNDLLYVPYAVYLPPAMQRQDKNAMYGLLRVYQDPVCSVNTILYSGYLNKYARRKWSESVVTTK